MIALLISFFFHPIHPINPYLSPFLSACPTLPWQKEQQKMLTWQRSMLVTSLTTGVSVSMDEWVRYIYAVVVWWRKV